MPSYDADSKEYPKPAEGNTITLTGKLEVIGMHAGVRKVVFALESVTV
jgi:hypothetical protein